MAMTVMVTRNVPDRYRGFLASCMLEIAPGVYIQPVMRKTVRERIWSIMVEWSELLPPGEGGVVMLWPQKGEPSGMAINIIGWPKKKLVDVEGVWLAQGNLTAMHDVEELTSLVAGTFVPTRPDFSTDPNNS